MRTQENKEKYREYDHKYYIKNKRPKTKIGQAEAEIDQLKQQLAEKDKEIECWKDKTRNKIFNMKTTDFVKMCLSCGIMIDANQTQTQLAIQELEKVKNFVDGRTYCANYIKKRIKELKGEKDE